MTDRDACLESAFAALPLVAILRGLSPVEAEDVATALYEAGFRLIEVPLNSPDPLTSVAAIRALLPSDALVGAGTVLAIEHVERLAGIGADLIVMPHADTTIIRAAKAHGMVCVPGVATVTEAFAALAAGADALKLFPAELIGPRIVKAMRAVVPGTVRLLPVGGITPESMAPYLAAGASGFGIGSALYSPGRPIAELAELAGGFRRAWMAASAEAPR